MRCSRATSGSPPGRASCARPGSRAAWTSCAPARSWTSSSARTPGPAPPEPRAHRPRAAAGGTAQQPPGAGPAGGAAGGFAGQVTLTVPLGTAAGLADRPGELAGLGPVDPWLARDLAAAAARNPNTTWCVTVTDEHGHAVGHGCARPEPKSHGKRAGPGPPGGRVLLHPGQPGRPARRVRHLAAAHPGRRAGPDRRDRHPGHPELRAPVPGPGPRPRGQAAAPVPGPARHLHQPHLPAARLELRLRAQHPYQAGGRTCLCNGGPSCLS